MQPVHQPKPEKRQEENDRVVYEGAIPTDEIEMRIDPPGFVPDQIEEEGTEPHPKRVNGHEHECLEYFNKVDVETVIDGDFAEHENDRQDVDRNVKEYGHGAELDSAFEGVLLDRRVQDGPVDDDDNDVKHETPRVEELEEPQVPRGCTVSLASKVTRSETGQPVSVPSVQGKVTAEEEGTDVSEKEEELDGCLVRSETESEDEGHGQVNGTEKPKEEQVEGREAPGSVPCVQVVPVDADHTQQFGQTLGGDQSARWPYDFVRTMRRFLGGNVH